MMRVGEKRNIFLYASSARFVLAAPSHPGTPERPKQAAAASTERLNRALSGSTVVWGGRLL
jgi:hypothetical protein